MVTIRNHHATGTLYHTNGLANAVQQPLNPGLANYPDFVAGQAVKA